MKQATIMSTLALSSVFAVGCSSGAPGPGGAAVGIANPASTHCVSKGGKLVIRKDKDGNETGICHLPDGTQVEEWDLFRRDNPAAAGK